jgi:SsrA-binding protein
VQLADSYARIDDGEVWLMSLHISPYSHISVFDAPGADRKRKLLLHRSQIDRLKLRLDQEHLSLIPLSLYFKDGRAKVELGVGRGRKQYDKRQAIAKRDFDREAQRAMSRGASGKDG